MRRIILSILICSVFNFYANAQHYFTLPQLERICFKLNNEDIYAVRDYVQNVGYTALKVDDFYTFDDKYGNHFITSPMKSGKSKYVAFIVKNPTEKLIKTYMNVLDNKYNKAKKFYFKDGLYVIIADHDEEKSKFTITVAYNNRMEYPVPVVNLGNKKYQISSFSTLTPIKFKKGETITLKASGKINVGVFAGSSGPNGIKGFEIYNALKGFPHGSLLGRIGAKGKWFLIGNKKTVTSKTDGYLDVRVNDLDPSNNSGYFYLTYSINGASPKKLSEPITSKKSNCLLGDCYNEYSRKKYDNGDVYTGYFKAGIRHGKGGSYTWANGDKYFGEWLNGKRTGLGIYTWADGNSFEGKFDNGKRVDGLGTYKWNNGTKYKGYFVDKLLHGKGTLFYAKGGWYTGDFVKGKRHGKGKLYNAKGTIVYDGLWEQDKKTSQ